MLFAGACVTAVALAAVYDHQQATRAAADEQARLQQQKILAEEQRLAAACAAAAAQEQAERERAQALQNAQRQAAAEQAAAELAAAEQATRQAEIDQEATAFELIAMDNHAVSKQTADEPVAPETIEPEELGILPDPAANRVARADAAYEKVSGASIEGTLPNGEKVTIADFDSGRLAQMTPRRNPPHRNRHAMNGTVSEDEERLRFDSDDDYFSIFDNLSLGEHKNVDLSFELEFDPESTAERSDLTVFWGARDGEQHRNAWSGYEVKLGGPGINHVAYKYGGRDLVPRGQQTQEFQPGQRYQIDIEQRDGDVTVKVDGGVVFQADAKARGGQRNGFGLLFYQASGWVGPVQISTDN
jgi:hypothetical protein